ncbi:hypothetical protein ACFE04_006671 [Oxalis oulophora]
MAIVKLEMLKKPLINGVFKSMKISKLTNLLSEMHNHGLSPNIVTYEALIAGWCNQGKIDEAYTLTNFLTPVIDFWIGCSLIRRILQQPEAPTLGGRVVGGITLQATEFVLFKHVWETPGTIYFPSKEDAKRGINRGALLTSNKFFALTISRDDSLEQRIKPRYAVMKQSGMKLALANLLSTSHTNFDKALMSKIAKMH